MSLPEADSSVVCWHLVVTNYGKSGRPQAMLDQRY
jgi:hypothetical protein